MPKSTFSTSGDGADRRLEVDGGTEVGGLNRRQNDSLATCPQAKNRFVSSASTAFKVNKFPVPVASRRVTAMLSEELPFRASPLRTRTGYKILFPKK